MPLPRASVHHSVLLALMLGLSGCTAIKATVHLAQAEQALAEARNFDAQNLAAYEYTMAIRYLEKAREEAGSADHRVSESLSFRSMEWADKAIIAIERGRRGIDTLEGDFGDVGVAPTAPLEDLSEPVDLPEAPEPPPTPGEFDDLDDLDDFELDE